MHSSSGSRESLSPFQEKTAILKAIPSAAKERASAARHCPIREFGRRPADVRLSDLLGTAEVRVSSAW